MREHGDNAKKKANTKTEGDEPAEQRMPIFGTRAEPSSSGWIQGWLLGLCFLLLTLWAEWFVDGMRAKILTLAVGFTVVVWTVAAVKLWQLRGSPDKTKTPTLSGPAPNTSEAPSTTAAQLPENIEPAASEEKAPPPKPHPPKERTKALTEQPREANGQEPKVLPVAPAEPETFHETIDTYYFSLGGGGMNFQFSAAQLEAGGAEPFQIDDWRPIRVYLEKGKLFADFAIYAGPGVPPVEITRNDFKVRRLGWDRNFDKEALEVVDSNGRPVFQYIYKTPSHLVFNDYFPFPGGVFVATESGTVMNPSPGLPLPPLRRIFKYPGRRYPGQRE